MYSACDETLKKECVRRERSDTFQCYYHRNPPTPTQLRSNQTYLIWSFHHTWNIIIIVFWDLLHFLRFLTVSITSFDMPTNFAYTLWSDQSQAWDFLAPHVSVQSHASVQRSIALLACDWLDWMCILAVVKPHRMHGIIEPRLTPTWFWGLNSHTKVIFIS